MLTRQVNASVKAMQAAQNQMLITDSCHKDAQGNHSPTASNRIPSHHIGPLESTSMSCAKEQTYTQEVAIRLSADFHSVDKLFFSFNALDFNTY